MENMLQNTLVVVIGTGKKVWTLAERRVQEKGRLLVLLTDRPPERTYAEDTFAWFPPSRRPPLGEQARQMTAKFNARDTRRWLSKGPDIVELMDDEFYELHEDGRGIRALTKDGKILWEVSACCLIADAVTDVNNEPLGVSNGVFCAIPIPATKDNFLCILLWLLLLTIGTCFNDYEKEDMPPYFRLWNMTALAGCFGAIASNIFWGQAAVGIVDWNKRRIVQHCTLRKLTVQL